MSSLYIYAVAYDKTTEELEAGNYHKEVKMDWVNEVYYIDGVEVNQFDNIPEYFFIRKAMPSILLRFDKEHRLPSEVTIDWGW